MMRVVTLLFGLVACAAELQEQATLLVSERTSMELPVDYSTGDRLLGAQVPTTVHTGEAVEVTADFQWSGTPPDEVEFSLWKAGGAEPVLFQRFGLEQAGPGQEQRVVWPFSLATDFDEGPYWTMVRLRSQNAVVDAEDARGRL